MEILEITKVYFEGKGHINTLPVPFYVQNDQDRFWVNVPDVPEVVEAFQWMGDAKVLQYLVDLSPVYEDNSMEIAGIRDHNEQSFEIAVAAGAVQQEQVINPRTFITETKTTWPGLKTLPAARWKVTWSFWHTPSAVMMKLAVPGLKCDTLK